jgi:DNA-binding MarR family transcriptional regulator
MERRIEASLAQRGAVTLAQFAILYALSKEQSMTQNRIATILALTEATVSRHVSALYRKRFISRKTDPENRRAYIISLVPKGRAEFRRLETLIDRETRNIFSGTTVAERNHIASLLQQITKNLTTPS